MVFYNWKQRFGNSLSSNHDCILEFRYLYIVQNSNIYIYKMFQHVWIFFLILLTHSTTTFPQQNDVLVLTDSNFQAALKQYPELLVDFYAPWCNHCKQLAPELDKAAQSPKLKIKIAKIDAEQNKQTATKYNIESFPTLMYFAEDFQIVYRSFRTAPAIISWLEHKQQPFIVVINQKELDELASSKLTRVYFYGKRTDKNFEAWRMASIHGENQEVYALVESQELFGENPQGSVVLATKRMSQPLVFQGSLDHHGLKYWVEKHSSPPIRPFQQKTAKLIFQYGRPAIFLVNRGADSANAISALQNLCSFTDHEYVCTQITPKQDIYDDVIKWLKVTKDGSFLMLLDTQNTKLYMYPQEIQDISNEQLSDWIRLYEEGTLQPVDDDKQNQQDQQQQQQQEQNEANNNGEYNQGQQEVQQQTDL